MALRSIDRRTSERMLRLEAHGHLIQPLEVLASRAVRNEKFQGGVGAVMDAVGLGRPNVNPGARLRGKSSAADFNLARSLGHEQDGMASTRRNHRRAARVDFRIELRL